MFLQHNLQFEVAFLWCDLKYRLPGGLMYISIWELLRASFRQPPSRTIRKQGVKAGN
jgi:hypothetical protein